jgi:hypothetical protein
MEWNEDGERKDVEGEIIKAGYQIVNRKMLQ